MTSIASSVTEPIKRPHLKVVKNGDKPVSIDPAYAWRVTHRVMHQINKKYFRTQFVGFGKSVKKKKSGAPVIYASNHSGMAFPWDGMAMASGLFERSGYELQNAVRPIATPLLSKLPAMSPFLVNDFWGRQGAIGATMENFKDSMNDEGVNLLIYPEGIGGIGKGFNKRYEVQRISTSMVRMSIAHQADIVLVSTVGGEYINPWSYSIESINKISKKLGIPFIPVGPSLNLALMQPWMVYFAFPAKLTFVQGTTFRPYEMVQGRSLDEVTEREIRDIRDQIHEQMQSELDHAVETYGQKPFAIAEFIRILAENITSAHLYMPWFWPILFWENEYHSQNHPMDTLTADNFAQEAQEIIDRVIKKEWTAKPTLSSLWKTVKKNPEILSLYVPGLGLWKMARGKLK